MEHVPADVFGEDYLYFYEEWLNDELSDAQAELIWDVLALNEGDEVLDVPCGHGRIANRLARRGAHVTGLDADALFLERARGGRRPPAASRSTTYRATCASCRGRGASTPRSTGSPRSATSTTTGTAPGSRRCWATLKPGGRLAIDVHSRDVFMRNRVPASVYERDGDLVVDRHQLRRRDRPGGDGALARSATGRCGRRATRCASTRTRSCATCCSDVGFSSVEGVGHDRKPLTLESRRMIVIATR